MCVCLLPTQGKKQGATISKGSGGKVRKKTAGTGDPDIHVP